VCVVTNDDVSSSPHLNDGASVEMNSVT